MVLEEVINHEIALLPEDGGDLIFDGNYFIEILQLIQVAQLKGVDEDLEGLTERKRFELLDAQVDLPLKLLFLVEVQHEEYLSNHVDLALFIL